MQKAKLLLVLFIIVLSAMNIDSRKKKKKAKKQKAKPDQPFSNKRPDKVKPELYCDACQAIIKEAVKELRGKKKESDIFDYMEKVCDPEKYYVYSHPPPEMREGCEAFINGWEEEIEKVLINRPDDVTPIDKLCNDVTRACVQVDPTNVKAFDDQIWVDGQPKKIEDGKIKEEEDL